MSNILNTPHRTTTTDPKFLNTPYSSFDKLTLNSNPNNNGRTRLFDTRGKKPSNMNSILNNVKRLKDDKNEDHPNTFMVFDKDNKKISMMDSLMNNEREGISDAYRSDDENDCSEDDETNSYSPGRLSVSPDRGFLSQTSDYEDELEEPVVHEKVKRMIDDDIFGSSPINKTQHKKPNDLFSSNPFRGKALFNDDVFGSTAIIKTQNKKDPYLDTGSSWLDDIYVPPKHSKAKNKSKCSVQKSIKSSKSNNDLHSLASSSASSPSYSSYSSLSTASTSSSSSSLSSLSTSPSTSSITSSPSSSNNQRKNNNVKATGKENDAPKVWLQYFGNSKSKYTKTPKETDTNNHTTSYTGPLCEITISVKPEEMTASTSNSSTDSDDLHVRKKKVLNISPKRVRFMRSLSPIRSDSEPRKGKEPNNQKEEHHPIQQIR